MTGPIRTLAALARLEARAGAAFHGQPPRFDVHAAERERLRVAATGLHAAIAARSAAAHASLAAADPAAAAARHRRVRAGDLARAARQAHTIIKKRVEFARAGLIPIEVALNAGLAAAQRRDRLWRRGREVTRWSLAIVCTLAAYAMARDAIKSGNPGLAREILGVLAIFALVLVGVWRRLPLHRDVGPVR